MARSLHNGSESIAQSSVIISKAYWGRLKSFGRGYKLKRSHSCKR
jgi:hypothetical protein